QRPVSRVVPWSWLPGDAAGLCIVAQHTEAHPGETSGYGPRWSGDRSADGGLFGLWAKLLDPVATRIGPLPGLCPQMRPAPGGRESEHSSPEFQAVGNEGPHGSRGSWKAEAFQEGIIHEGVDRAANERAQRRGEPACE